MELFWHSDWAFIDRKWRYFQVRKESKKCIWTREILLRWQGFIAVKEGNATKFLIPEILITEILIPHILSKALSTQSGHLVCNCLFRYVHFISLEINVLLLPKHLVIELGLGLSRNFWELYPLACIWMTHYPHCRVSQRFFLCLWYLLI